MNDRLNGIVYVNVDATRAVNVPPSWMLTRWHERDRDFSQEEREEVAAAGVTDFEDFGFGGICFNRREDAEKVAVRMADRFGIPFGVFGPDGEGKDGILLALPPQLRELPVGEAIRTAFPSGPLGEDLLA